MGIICISEDLCEYESQIYVGIQVLFYYLLNNNYRSILELMKLLSRIVQHLNLMPPSETDIAFYLQLGDKKIEVQSGWSQAFHQTDS